MLGIVLVVVFQLAVQSEPTLRPRAEAWSRR
jgi:hypothetical protein